MSFFSSRHPAPVLVPTEVMQALAESDLAREAMAARAAGIAARRVEVAAAIAAEEKAAVETNMRKYKERDECAGAVRAAEKALQDARNRMAVTFRVGLAASLAHSSTIAALEADLRETASPAVAEFIEWIDDEQGRLRRTSISTQTETKRHVLTGEIRRRVVASDGGTVKARSEALRDARAQAEALYLMVDQSGVPAAIARIKATLPEINMEEPPAEPDAAQRAETNITNPKDLKNGH